MTTQQLNDIFVKLNSIENKLNLVESHLQKHLDKLQDRIAHTERQMYAVYALGGIHIMLMGFVLKKLF